tara:strand:- start:12869 stop:13318 length:450 start_codon:yes stop_codon:yes gene_type:complete
MTRIHDDFFGSFGPFTIGLDRLVDQLEHAKSVTSNYPPYNIIKKDDENYLIEMGVAGFTKKDITIEMKENNLTVSGKKEDSDKSAFVHRGLSGRSFTKNFVLASDVEVRRVDLADGILTVKLVKVIPEEMKPKSIEIGKDVSVKSFLAE